MPVPVILYRALGIGLAILLMEGLAQSAEVSYAQVPFVTSIVLAIALPDTPAASPRAIIGGHVLSAVAGLLVLHFAGTADIAAGLAVGLAALAMALTRTLHPPAGLDAFLVVTQSLPVFWLVVPVLPGAVLLAAFAWVWKYLGNRLFTAAQTQRPIAQACPPPSPEYSRPRNRPKNSHP